MPPFDVLPAGDSALIVRLAERIDPGINAWCIELARAVERRFGPTVRDVVIGYCSVTLYFDPLRTDGDWLEQEVRGLAAVLEVETGLDGALLDIPVCYDDEFGPDLDDVARFGGCSTEDVVALHSATIYRVYLVGFVPGFAYMAEVESRIAAPRRRAPRTAVPPGSVAIAGGQTGIYPSATPGGWNIVGRTPVRPCDFRRAQPFLFSPGDRVRFQPITLEEFHGWHHT